MILVGGGMTLQALLKFGQVLSPNSSRISKITSAKLPVVPTELHVYFKFLDRPTSRN
jgi:hypothetical protein